MENYNESLLRLFSSSNGVVTTTEVTKSGIPRYKLKEWIDSGIIYKIERGIYAKPEAGNQGSGNFGSFDDDLFALQYRYRKGIFSHSTALYLHNLIDKVPLIFTMTFPYGYHSSKIKEYKMQIKNTKYYDLGIVEVISPMGNSVRVYDIERSICDIFKDTDSDIQVLNQGIKNYIFGGNKNIPKLLEYAEILRIKPKITSYLEILL